VSKVEADHAVLIEPFSGNPVNAIVVFMEFIITQLIEHEEQNQDAAGHSDSQSCNIDEAVARVFLDIPKGNFQVVLKHVSVLPPKRTGFH